MPRILKHLISLVIAIIIVMLIQTFLVRGYVVQDKAMQPTLSPEDRVIINKVNTMFNRLHGGDVILYRQYGQLHISRIIGQPGETIEFKKGQLYRNDQQVDEPYATQGQIKHLELRHVKGSEGDIVPPDAYFVLNDPRNNQSDSRTYGYIQHSDIIGHVSFRYYPLQRMTWQFKGD
ncbi:signal peptidase I [Staphylococcus argensis]|uniref:signal peptidase I n=1 Tax=Staphylococcus argensis TaxID=1607738 RepID=UPI0011A343D4|nr:signal peptidase I [Staphylococcus argensis]